MKRSLAVVLACLVASTVSSAASSRAAQASCGSPSGDALFSVVRVAGSHGVAASGVVVADGLVVTVAHVIERDADLTIARIGGHLREATLLRIDSARDLALLGADTSGIVPITVSSGELRTGESVWTAGYPRAGNLTYSRGTLRGRTGLRRAAGREQHTTAPSQYLARLRTDALVDSGQSGGALFHCVTGAHQLAGIVHGYPRETARFGVDELGPVTVRLGARTPPLPWEALNTVA